jgi:hypothetical protein
MTNETTKINQQSTTVGHDFLNVFITGGTVYGTLFASLKATRNIIRNNSGMSPPITILVHAVALSIGDGSSPTRNGDKPNARNTKFSITVIGHGNKPLNDCPR